MLGDIIGTIMDLFLDLGDANDRSTLLTAKAFGFLANIWFIVLPLVYVAILILQIVVNGFGIQPFIGSLLATALIAIAAAVLTVFVAYLETLAKHVASLLMHGSVGPSDALSCELECLVDGMFVRK